MPYLVTGATSGTGVTVMRRLRDALGAEAITCLVRPTSDAGPLHALGLRVAVGDVTAPDTIGPLLGPDTVYLDMTHPSYYPRIIPLLTQAGVQRVFFVTTTGIFSRYHRCSGIYKDGEALIKASGLTYTIMRPSMIYGSMRDKNMHKLILLLQRTPVFPLFNAGTSLMQPVFVDDLADGIVTAIQRDSTTIGKEYNLAGPTEITYRSIIETIMQLLNRRVRLFSVDSRLAYAMVRALQWLPGFPINDEQVLRLNEDKVFDIAAAVQDLDFTSRPFAEGIGQEIDDMRAAGVLRPTTAAATPVAPGQRNREEYR